MQKAKDNVEKYDLPKKVKYFYSHPLSNTQVLTYKKKAKDEYGLILDIVEANALAGIAAQYDTFRTLLYKLSEFEKYIGDSDFFDDSRVRSFYDLMSFGTSTDIKYNILKSYVLNYLFTHGQGSPTDILNEINKHFSARIEYSYFEGFCRRLSSEQKIKTVGFNRIDLTESEKARIHGLLEEYKVEEGILKKELHEVLHKYGLESHIDDIIIKLSELYESNYAINLGEFTKRNSSINDLRTATQNFNNFIKDKLKDEKDSEVVAKELITIADKNEILSRIAAGQVYSKVSDPNRLQEYITRHNNIKEIFLDTNIIINALCVYYDFEADYDNYYFKVAKQFLDFADKNQLKLKTIKYYEVETINIFKEALTIIPFTKLPIFELLGGSKNILYNYYSYLVSTHQIHEGITTFEQFLKEFGFEIRRNDPDYHYLPQMENLLDSLGVDIINHPMYEIGNAKALIIEDLKESSRSKSSFAINNDAIMFMRLADRDTEINPIDPIFCTWDTSLFRVRKKFFEDFPSCTKWLMYTPTRLMDHFSMMNFKVKQGTLSNEVLSILEEDFSFQEKTQSLLDTMLTIINPENKVGLQYANKLAELRKQEIIQVDNKEEAIVDDGPDSNAVDIVFHKLFVNYMNQSKEGVFDSFKAVFTKEEIFDQVFEVLSKEVKFVSQHGTTSADLFSKMDIFIEKAS